MKLAGEVTRVLKCNDPYASVRLHIDKGGGHLAPVPELQGSLAKTAAGDHTDGVGGAAIDLDECDEALAVRADGIVDTKDPQPEESHANAKDLTGAHVS